MVLQLYLSGHRQRVCIGTEESDASDVQWSVPQRSVFRPLNFIVYSSPIGDTCRKHSLAYHLYADDTQLYLTFKHGSAGCDTVTIHTVEICIANIRGWMATNFLKLNGDKTEFLFIVSARRCQGLYGRPSDWQQFHICSMFCANLRASFWPYYTVSMERHVNNICPSAMHGTSP